MTVDELREKLRITEKRTFVCQMKCECGGTYIYNIDNATSDIFSMLINSANSKKTEYEHKCSECKKVKKYNNRYPLELSFEVGIDTDKETLVNFIATEFDKIIHEDIYGTTNTCEVNTN